MSEVRYNIYEGKSTTEFTSTKHVLFVIKLFDGDKIEQFDYNIKIHRKLITSDYLIGLYH